MSSPASHRSSRPPADAFEIYKLATELAGRPDDPAAAIGAAVTAIMRGDDADSVLLIKVGPGERRFATQLRLRERDRLLVALAASTKMTRRMSVAQAIEREWSGYATRWLRTDRRLAASPYPEGSRDASWFIIHRLGFCRPLSAERIADIIAASNTGTSSPY